MTSTTTSAQQPATDGSFVKGALYAILSLTLLTVAIGGLYARQDDPAAPLATTTAPSAGTFTTTAR